MNFSEETYGLIDRYLKGTLPEQEKLAFEKQMAGDVSLAEEVEMQKLVNELVLEKGLADIRQKAGEQFPAGTSGGWNKLIMFFTVSVLVGAGVLYFMFNRNESTLKVTDAVTENKKVKKEIADQPIEPQYKDPEVKTSSRKKESIQTPFQKEESVTQPADEEPVSTVMPSEEPAVKEDSREVEPEKKTKDQACPEISFMAEAQPSCNNRQTGRIQVVISSIKGGEQPYAYSWDGKHFGLSSVHEQLASGNYLIEIKDKNGCIGRKQVTVGNKACIVYKDYTLNPESDTWKFPFAEGENGTIKITDKSGRVVYSAHVMNGNPYEWDGKNMNGSILETGSYVYIAESDKGEIRQGYIIVVH